jgi:hypothetical protein
MMTAADSNGEEIMERDETLDVGDVLNAAEVTAWLLTADRPDVSGMSHYRENLLEHVFIAEVLQACARRRRKVEVLRAEVDDAGYDLVLESNGVIRHIQLKSRSGKNRNPLVVNENLQEHVGGCVVLLDWYLDHEARISMSYRWWGTGPGEMTGKLPERRATGQWNMRRLTLGSMEVISSVDTLVERLFG